MAEREPVKILGYDYTIVRSGLTDDIGAFGRFHASRQRIQVATNLVPQQVTSTILHEIIEALNYHLELGISHQAVMSLEAGLVQVLRDAGVNLDVLQKYIEAGE